MDIKSYWGKYIAAYRRANKLSQAQLAEIFEVSTPTISRWETGKQVPDQYSQDLLRRKLMATKVYSKEEWICRVSHAHDYEILTDVASNILAVSLGIAEYWGKKNTEFVALNLFELIPGGAKTVETELERLGLGRDLIKRLTTGSIRQVYIAIDYRFKDKCGSLIGDVWVMATPDPKTLIHYVWCNTELAHDIESVDGLRIRDCEVTTFS